MAIETWQIDSAHSAVQFTVRHLVIAKVRGQFGRWSGTLEVPDGDFARATARVTIDAGSLDTGVAERDAHLRSADFFHVEEFPEIAFAGERVEPTGEGTFRLHGELTIRGITRGVSLDVEAAGRARDPWGNERAVFSARTAIDRKEFGLTWNQALETGGVLVGDRVEIEIDVEAVRQSATRVA